MLGQRRRRGPALKQHWLNASFLLGNKQQSTFSKYVHCFVAGVGSINVLSVSVTLEEC